MIILLMRQMVDVVPAVNSAASTAGTMVVVVAIARAVVGAAVVVGLGVGDVLLVVGANALVAGGAAALVVAGAIAMVADRQHRPEPCDGDRQAVNRLHDFVKRHDHRVTDVGTAGWRRQRKLGIRLPSRFLGLMPNAWQSCELALWCGRHLRSGLPTRHPRLLPNACGVRGLRRNRFYRGWWRRRLDHCPGQLPWFLIPQCPPLPVLVAAQVTIGRLLVP